MQVTETREVMNIHEAAEYLGISEDTVYRYAQDATFPAFKLGNRWKFKKSLLDAWMETECRDREPQKGRR